MAKRKIRYACCWKEGKTKHQIITPHLGSRGAALYYLLQQKPYLETKLKELTIRQWDRNIPK